MTTTQSTKAGRVLLVDDDEFLLRALARTCRQFGVDAETACHGREALDKLAHGSFALILCDVRMPVMDGLQFLREINERGLLPCPIVFLTGYSDYEPEQLLERGATAVHVKPLPADDVRALLTRYAEAAPATSPGT